jgi:hypothetical protein
MEHIKNEEIKFEKISVTAKKSQNFLITLERE